MKHLFLLFSLIFFLGCSTSETEISEFKVLQFNIWQEGTMVAGGYEGLIQQIIDSNADIVCLSEVRNYNNTRLCDRMVQSLKERGKTFYSFYSVDSGILSRFPIKDSTTVFPENNDHGSIYGALVEISGQEFVFYTAHLDYLNCAYYLVKGYSGTTWEKLEKPITDIDSILKNNELSQRDDAIKDFLEAAQADRDKGRIVMIGGDFNEPSHLDWTEETKDLNDRQGLVIPWTVSTLMEKGGFIDAYRFMHRNPLTHPGVTYPSDCESADINKLTWAPEADERERIDFIHYTPHPSLELKEAIIWGPTKSICRNQRVEDNTQDVFRIGKGIWPTDHKAVLCTFEFTK